MARPAGPGLSELGEKATLLRSVAGAIAADNASLVDANYPVAAAFDSTGFDTVLIGVEIDGGTLPTATIELLFRDEDAPDGQRWKRNRLGAREGVVAPGGAPVAETSGAITPGVEFLELVTYGQNAIFPRVSAVANSATTTALRIIAKPGMVRGARSFAYQRR